MRIIGIFTGALCVAACGGSDQPDAGGGALLPAGVYECDSAQMIGGMVMPRPEPAFMFAVTGPGRYRNFDGGAGRFELADGFLVMTSGPLEGARYRQDSETHFVPLTPSGDPSGARCIHNPTKDINQPW